MLELPLVLLVTLSGSGVAAQTAPSQLPSVQTMADRLASGRLILDQVRFRPSDEALAEGATDLLRQTARALNRVEGKFAVYVPPERIPRFPPDTVLSRRRSMAAYRALLAAGSSLEHLIGATESDGAHPGGSRAVPPGQARIELVRIE